VGFGSPPRLSFFPFEEIVVIKALEPNAKISSSTQWVLIGGWIITTLLFWTFVMPHISVLIPKPGEVLKAGLITYQQGAVFQLVASVVVSFSAIVLSMIVGLSLSYLSTVPLFKAPVAAIGSMRTLSLTGMTFIFVLATPNSYWLKVATLTFSIVVFLVNNMLQVIDDIPQAKFDHARTMGMSQWEVTREVVIRGTLASAFDTIRMTAAMAWMMLTMVEANARSDGGIGITLIELARQSNYAGIFAVQFMIFSVGLGQDRLIQFAKTATCPYTKGQ
jgi:ABC-type nitrate/sulfonate/bicarbonate transport system permease component